ncbi:molybdenum cofactor guanylyltransferase [Granulicella sp. WH15]|uniref:molybdenum cofactor guanylyltransferase n=1 Tax=Granulicella sp. WH15 TaxID=2602070 RepID=UPI001366F998|nr:molybdenum cofactor guanylyltransferase [Granulicella sp. WH15]QHN02968.1 molybdenum cofactor guanylyltransferase [Granulicella sp. WH15]
MAAEVGGYVLSGGRSSRMGRDKALLELAGRPLIEHAVTKLRRVCEAVHVLGSSSELERYAPMVTDLHPECGPMGGVEAALAHTAYEWNLIVPVDVPFLPVALLEWWVQRPVARVAMFTVEGMPQPTVLLVHRDVGRFVSKAIAQGNYRLRPVMEEAGRELGGSMQPVEEIAELARLKEGALPIRWWFANLNTPEEFAEAERLGTAWSG